MTVYENEDSNALLCETFLVIVKENEVLCYSPVIAWMESRFNSFEVPDANSEREKFRHPCNTAFVHSVHSVAYSQRIWFYDRLADPGLRYWYSVP